MYSTLNSALISIVCTVTYVQLPVWNSLPHRLRDPAVEPERFRRDYRGVVLLIIFINK